MSDITVHTIDLDFLGQKRGIAAFLVESTGGPILVETGPHSTWQNLVAGIRLKGYQPEDISHVFITHIHLDHAGAAWCFANRGAKIYLHPRGYKHLHQPDRLLASAKMIYQENMDRLWGTLEPIPEDQLIMVEHLEDISVNGISVRAHHTPGHAQHHIAWQMEDILFTGDVAGVSINNGPVIPPCPPPDIHLETWISSIDHILSLTGIKAYYLTHFGCIDNTDVHMSRLKKALYDYTTFIRPFAEDGKSAEECLPEFQRFVKNYLIDHGLNEADAAAYEAANPTDMSATGLMRYWKKKLSLI